MLHFFPFIAHVMVTGCYLRHCLRQRANHNVQEAHTEYGIVFGYTLLTIHSLVGA